MWGVHDMMNVYVGGHCIEFPGVGKPLRNDSLCCEGQYIVILYMGRASHIDSSSREGLHIDLSRFYKDPRKIL